MDNNDERNPLPELIDPPPDKPPLTHPEPLPPRQPPTPKINASALFPENEFPRKKKDSPLREKNINKPTPFTSDRKKVEMFIQECKMYLRIN